MPTVSPAQHRLMEAAAHTKGGFGGVPQKVGKEFVAKDARRLTAAQLRERYSAEELEADKVFDKWLKASHKLADLKHRSPGAGTVAGHKAAEATSEGQELIRQIATLQRRKEDFTNRDGGKVLAKRLKRRL